MFAGKASPATEKSIAPAGSSAKVSGISNNKPPITSPMNIDQLSRQIKEKTAKIDQKIASLEARRQQSTSPSSETGQQLTAEIAALQELKTKLAKSGDIARRAYELQQGGPSEEARLRQRRLAIALCVFSGAGLLVIAGILLLR